MTVTIYHNPGCSKSRKTLELLGDAGVSPAIVEYLKTPPSAAETLRLAAMLDRADWTEMADKTLGFFSANLERAPQVMPQMLVALDLQRNPPVVVVIAGERDLPMPTDTQRNI